MTCKWQETDVWRYYDQEMDADESHLFAAHLTGCPLCRKELDQLGFVSATLRETHAVFTESNRLDGLEARVMVKTRQQPERFRGILHAAFRFGPYRMLAAAAMFLIVFSSFWLYWLNPLTEPGMGAAPQLAQVDYFYSNTDQDVLYYDLDADVKVIWILAAE